MNTALMVILAVVSVILILVILLQPSNSDGLSGSITGGQEQFYGKKRTNAYEILLKRVTVVLTVAFIVLSLVLVTIGSK